MFTLFTLFTLFIFLGLVTLHTLYPFFLLDEFHLLSLGIILVVVLVADTDENREHLRR